MNISVSVSMKRLSMLQVLEPSGGGSGRHFLDLCRSMQHRGHSVTAIYSPVRAEQRFVDELEGMGLDGVHAVKMDRQPGLSDISAWGHIRQIIREQGPFDLIHGHSSKAGALTRMRMPGSPVPVIYTPHAFRTMDPTLGRKGRFIFGGIERALGDGFSDLVICVSDDEYDHAVKLGIPAHRLRMVVNGVAQAKTGHRKAIRHSFGIPDDATVYGFVGRLSAQKAPERLVNAFARVAALNPSAYLLMIGSGELDEELRNLIAALRLEGRVFLDASTPGPVAMDAFDVVVAPSRYEAMSYVMLEAAAAGKPLIATDVGGARTVINLGCNGLIIPNEDDPTALALCMSKLGEEITLKRFTREAERRRERFTLARMADETEELYFNLLGYRAPSLLRTTERALQFG